MPSACSKATSRLPDPRPESLVPRTHLPDGARRMKATLSTRLIVWVGVPAALVLGAVVWNASRRSFDRVAAQTEELSRLMARSYAAELENGLSKVRKIPEMIGRTLETGHIDTSGK